MKAIIHYDASDEIELPDEFDQYASLIDMYNRECIFGGGTLSKKSEDIIHEVIERIDLYCKDRIDGYINSLELDDPSFKDDGLVIRDEDGYWMMPWKRTL